ncbi:MAG: TonB-dependent receptor [Bacteroidia bacterium]|nr:TonB-dependent receptor [Bacteroidia bacterium]
MNLLNRILKVIVLLIVFASGSLQGATIKGVVSDSISNEPLVEIKISIVGTKFKTISGFDGSYSIKNIPAGNYILKAGSSEYSMKEYSIQISNLDTTYKADFFLMPNIVNQIEGVNFRAHIDKESDESARKAEKHAGSIVNIMSAKTIQLLPDITTAGVLQRVSGVSLERTSTGDARYAIIRGMDQRYNYTLINGIKIPSPDNKYRYVPMDMFPADLLERLEVIKSLTPSMEGDAIGGAMNLIMKNAPDKLTITANIGSGFSQLLSNRGYTNFDRSVVNYNSPSDINGPGYIATPNDFTYKNFDYKTKSLALNGILGFSIGNRFLKNKKLGVIFAGSYQNLHRGSNSIWFQPENQPQPGNIPSFNDIFIREYNVQQSRLGLQTKIDYQFNKKHSISLFLMDMKLNETQYRHTIDTSLSIGRSGSGTGNTYTLYRSRMQDQNIINATLQGTHKLIRHLKMDWSGVYSIAKSTTPDWSEYQTVEVVGYDIDGKHTSTPPVLNIPFYRIWTRNSDKDLAAYLNFNYKLKVLRQEITISTGGLYRSKVRDNHYNEWDLIPKTSSTGQPEIYDGHLTADKFQFNGTSAAQGNEVNPLTYKATELITAYYLQFKIELRKNMEILGGVRVENTTQTWTTVQDPKLVYGVKGYIPYSDFLPSLQVKYKLSKKENLRFSYFNAINRPGFFEYVPFKVNDDNFSLSGNPKLKHTTSDNYDIRYEYFAKGQDQLLLGGFYKTIYNPIETGVSFTGTSSATLMPFNFGTATNLGLELSFIKYFGKYGISGNYTYTYSRIKTSKLFYNESFIAEQTSQVRPLQGQSPHIANLSFLYKNSDLGLEMQIAGVYTGKKITYLSPYKDLDYWQRAMTIMDFSIEKKVNKYFTFYCKVSNLLNTPVIVEILQPNIYKTGKFALTDQNSDTKITVQKDYYGQNYTVGLRFKI